MTLDEAIKLYTSNAEYERTHGCLQGYLNFRQLAGWLKDYKRTGEITNKQCHCDIDGSWLSYVTVMTYWCKHWSRERAERSE